jgi:hypothetical protein
MATRRNRKPTYVTAMPGKGQCSCNCGRRSLFDSGGPRPTSGYCVQCISLLERPIQWLEIVFGPHALDILDRVAPGFVDSLLLLTLTPGD